MNKQVLSIALLLFLFIFSSCSSVFYQIANLESKEVDDNFRYSNEDIILDYDFWARGGDLNFTITNKSNSPIFIDWEHSNFIFNGYSYDYFNDQETITNLGVYSSGSLSALVDIDNSDKTVTPANAKVTNANSLSVASVRKEKKFIQIPPKAYVQTKVVNLDFPWLNIKSGKQTFNESNTVLKVRTYLGYSTNKSLDSLKYIDNEFWVKDVERVRRGQLNKQKGKNKYYTSHRKVDGPKTLVLLGVLGTILLVIVAGAK